MTDSPFSVSSDSRWFDYNCSPKWGMAPYLANPEAHLYESESITNNLIGFILALASGAFIGSSFIIKKLGLQRAGASGPRAGKYFLILIFWEKRFTQSRCIIYVFLIYEWLTFFFVRFELLGKFVWTVIRRKVQNCSLKLMTLISIEVSDL